MGENSSLKPSRFEARKQEILDSAGALFNTHGLRDATLSVLASDIGLNLKSLRYYFEKKEDLVSAAFLHSISLHTDLVSDALTVKPFEQRIRHFLNRYFELLAKVARGDIPEFVHFGDIRALGEPYLSTVGSAYVGLWRATRRLFDDMPYELISEQKSAYTQMLLSQLHWSVVCGLDLELCARGFCASCRSYGRRIASWPDIRTDGSVERSCRNSNAVRI